MCRGAHEWVEWQSGMSQCATIAAATIKNGESFVSRSRSSSCCPFKKAMSTSTSPNIEQHPDELNQQAIYNRIGVEIADQDIPENSKLIKNRIQREWHDYCMHIDPQGTFPLQMTSTKVYNFMFYQLFRHKKRGAARMSVFDGGEYDRVLAEYRLHFDNHRRTGQPIPHPPEGVGKSSLQQYRAYLRKIHASHVAENLTSIPFELVFTEPCKNLVRTGEARKTKQDRENYKEKVDKIFGPYQAVEKMDELRQPCGQGQHDFKEPAVGFATGLFFYTLLLGFFARSLYSELS
jgi:hypothetical protein